jgi:protein phosphatase 1 regulatory subunit 42
MIRNIPNKYTKELMLKLLSDNFKGQYDFFYLPIDFKNNCNVGYAFINFIDLSSILPFCQEFNNQKWPKFNSEKICKIRYARI